MSVPITFRFNPKKAAQAACKILKLSGGKRNYMELVKLLYWADRKALVSLGAPITGDRFMALPYGPVLSKVLDLIRNGPIYEQDAPWFDLVSPPAGYDVHLNDANKCPDDELSGAEEQVLEEVFAEFGKKDWRELSRLSHRLPEWSAPVGSPAPISFEQVLLLEGKKPEQVAKIAEQSLLYRKLDAEIESYREAGERDEIFA